MLSTISAIVCGI